MIKKIIHKKKTLAIIINSDKFKKKGTNFASPNNFTKQVGIINMKKKHVIKPHTHTRFLRKIYKTSEVLIMKKGKLRVDFYSNSRKYLFSKIIKKNDIIILNEGSHGFKMLENCSMIEVKQGPFIKTLDKIRFEKVEENKIKIKN
tara:strand:+ start:1522 stop:1956 length:435 start_codon:yes stop_codon:yes gene_type:complete